MSELIEAVRAAVKEGSDGWFNASEPPDPEDGESGFWVPQFAWQRVLDALPASSDSEHSIHSPQEGSENG